MQAQLTQLEADYGIEWQSFKIGDLFEIKPTKNYGLPNSDLLLSKGSVPVVSNTSINNGITAYVDLKPTEKGNIITFSDTTTDEAIFYQPHDFVGYSHIQGMYKKIQEPINKYHYLFIVTSFKKAIRGKYNYGNKFNRENASNENIYLPTLFKDGQAQIAFDYMEAFIATLKAYLKVTDLDNPTLTPAEQTALDRLDSIVWNSFKLEELFDHIVQGRRLKKEDQIRGTLPFVMAGITNTGVVNYIENKTKVFPQNSLTIDIFGNVFYRNYEYGMGDDTGAYWNESKQIPKLAMLYIVASVQKAMRGKFDYGNKLRSSRSRNLKIALPITPEGLPDYEAMSLIVSALQKVVIKDVVSYLDKRIDKTEERVDS
ncbi:MAG: restriction endonuclease subunit S [Vampirovibrionales bacterium]